MRAVERRCLLLVAVCCLLLAACAAGNAAPTPTGSLLPSTPDALPQMDAATFSAMLAQQHGTPVVVNFWASWCPPCRAEAPELAAAAERYRDTVRFIGVNAQDDRGGATQYIEQYGLPYPSVFDPTNAIAISYGLYSPPSTLFFDADGRLVDTVPGQLSPEDLQRELRAITAPGA
jgi:cytochrome c biogenesis protein CcmG/thiol:disulfide interchange protein DsbE